MSLVIRGNPWLASERKREKGSFVLSKNGPRCVHHTRPPSHYSSVITVVARATPRELDTSRTIVMWRFIRWISLCPGKTGPFIARRWIIGLFARRLWLRVSESRIILTISMVFLSPSLSLSLSLSLSVGYLRGFLRESTTWDQDDGYSPYLYDSKRNSFVDMNVARRGGESSL